MPSYFLKEYKSSWKSFTTIFEKLKEIELWKNVNFTYWDAIIPFNISIIMNHLHGPSFKPLRVGLPCFSFVNHDVWCFSNY
jgi:hypothetical protein